MSGPCIAWKFCSAGLMETILRAQQDGKLPLTCDTLDTPIESGEHST